MNEVAFTGAPVWVLKDYLQVNRMSCGVRGSESGVLARLCHKVRGLEVAAEGVNYGRAMGD